MTQPSLFDAPPPVSRYAGVKPDHAEQAAHLERVRTAIAPHVLAFCRERIGQAFHGRALSTYVEVMTGCAPASPDRILRDLRRRGLLAYEVTDRGAATYLVTEVGE